MDVLEQLAVVSKVEPTARAVLCKARADLVEAASHEELRAWDQNDVVMKGPNGTAQTVSPLGSPLDRRPPAPARRARRLSLLVVVAAALVAVGLVARPSHVVEHPKAVHHPKLGVTAELQLIATNASAQSIPSVSGDRLLFTETQMSILAHVAGGASSTVTAQATVGLTVKRWSNATGQSCTFITADPAQFPSPAVHSTWTGLGLRDGPATQPVTGCSDENSGGGGIGALAPDAITGNGGVIDVSHLPVSPSSLAEDLQLTTTGIPALDHLSQGPIPNIAFERAAVILIGPTTGASSAFSSALFQALSRLPGVTGLGNVTTHNGELGQGFSNGDTTIIFDPATGTLLEARNIEDSGSITTLANEYLGPGPLQIRNYDATIQWIDPVGAPALVGIDSLPSDVPLEIFATVKAGVTQNDVFTLGKQLLAMFGRPTGADSYVAAGVQGPNTPSIVEYGFSGPTPQFHDFLNTVRSSGLFSSVDVI